VRFRLWQVAGSTPVRYIVQVAIEGRELRRVAIETEVARRIGKAVADRVAAPKLSLDLLCLWGRDFPGDDDGTRRHQLVCKNDEAERLKYPMVVGRCEVFPLCTDGACSLVGARCVCCSGSREIKQPMFN